MMCYSLYVWHVLLMPRLLAGHIDAVHLAYYAVALLALSVLTYRYVEFRAEPDWRKLFRTQP
jgi:peptidoglycan/LPS O-acetylase OafA/YrhL